MCEGNGQSVMPMVDHISVLQMGDLYQVAAGVIEYRYGGSDTGQLRRFHGELHAQRFQSFVLFLNVVDKEHGRGYALLVKSFLECLSDRVRVRLKDQLDTVLILWRDDGQPSVIIGLYVRLFHEAEFFGVERQRLFLVVNE
jgi:hypothetical protein